MKKRFILLIILTLSIAGLVFSSPPLQGSAALGDFYEDFENPFSGWSMTGQLWHRENNSQSAYLPWVPSSDYYMWYGSNSTGDYDTGSANSGTLTSDKIDLTSFEGRVKVGFWSWAVTENDPDNFDKMWVEISPDDGSTWDILGHVKDSSDWEYYSFEIPWLNYYSSSSVRIRFHFDTVDGSENNYPGWRIDDIDISEEPGYFDLYIHQGRYALAGDSQQMGFGIHSHFNYQKDVDVTIKITDPFNVNETVYPTQIQYIESFGLWSHSIDYTFKDEGSYRVILIVDDLSGGSYWTDCWWEIGPYFDVWINQENYALQYEYGRMDLYINSHYDYGMDIDIFVNITRPDGFNDSVYSAYNVYISSEGHFEDWFEYYFDLKGSYQVHMLVISDDGKKWWSYCWWEIGPYFDIRIYQDNEAMVGEEKWMTFEVESFHNDMDVHIKIIMELQSGKNIELHNEDRHLMSGEIWTVKYSFTFMETGHHHAKVVVTNTTNGYWEDWCCWNVYDQEKKFELWIDQENYADLDKEGWMYFYIDSFFDHGMDIDIKITIIRPDGTEELLFEEIYYIEAFGHWEYNLPYIFIEEGHYDVYLTVVDDMGKEWQAECWWKVGESDGDGGDDDQISPGFEGIFILGALVLSTILIRRRRK